MTQASSKFAAPQARFPGLDALRTILAVVVVCSHIEDCKAFFPSLPLLPLHGVFMRSGYEAVQCFFVLSGFLITYLLLQEQEKTGEISVRQFYWKRVLRIWPLYYTITLLGFFAVPALLNMAEFPSVMQSFHQKTWWFYVLILPNLALLYYPLVLGASQLWSIGIEEQFYLFWPWVVRACKKRLPQILFICIVSKPILVVLAHSGIGLLARRGIVESPKIMSALYYAHLIWKMFPFEALAWGGLFAWMVHSRNEYWPRIIGSKFGQVVCWGALLAWHIAPVPLLQNWHYQLPIAGLLYGLAIWNIGANPQPLIGLRSRWLNKFGALTYGVYMWHVLVIITVFSIAQAVDLPSKCPGWVLQVVLYTSVLGSTFLVAQLSFTWLEMPFLSLKNRWFGQVHESQAKSTLPTLASIASIPPSHFSGNASERKSGTRAA